MNPRCVQEQTRTLGVWGEPHARIRDSASDRAVSPRALENRH
ncbi:hypothetical protein LI99_17860 [Mycolicibacterium smegmatis]|uniref:Uncharacterized protein n=1 Tax=Mycolicibacterium smegmatis (strain ATCC 700084 / mc(2)155) TaxID=246196 RepID=A0QYA3_MYCS2|nr:hypothetical protein MSMEG_3588 [Mycolicibacterium smegmatis MC2 155]AIU15350.1 hypothetical protein LI99_17860 [Mycolicibacterium smegmatis]AIU08725.1 hypothetical protein LJ00_17855 [Mycolicibacterium smegmatis MC2 155]AIU21973.1 hypothetical protein LI98_17865 [Mycolicibacterium smegmatis]TBH47755.1 hypothetical protein EYS45_08700 [Mycolicibacterium smegmatis MC2 155]